MSLADDRIDDKDIGPLWAAHFSQRHGSMRSLTLCFTLLLILQSKAERRPINDVLREFNIPLRDFDQVGQEYDAFEQSIKNYKHGNN